MTLLPISNPQPAPRETVYSYLSRLAATWRTEVADLAYDMGAPFKRLLNQDEGAFETMADWARLAPDDMEELLSWTGVKAGNVRMEFRGELYISRALRNPVMRGCPVCLRDDTIGQNGASSLGMVMRGDWQFREVTLCVRHGHPLVPLWSATAPKDRFDIGARLREIDADILSGALDQPTRTPSGYDLWLDRRLANGSDDTWFKDHPVFVVTTFLRLLGQALSRSATRKDEPTSEDPHALGFDAAVGGPDATRATLDQIAEREAGHMAAPQKAYGHLYLSLNRDYLEEEGFEPFRRLLRDSILAHWPIGPGEIVLGEEIIERRFHSLVTAEAETGIGVGVLEQFLTEAGAFSCSDTRPPSRRLFDARSFATLLAEIPTLVGPIEMRNAMGATKQEFAALIEDGVLSPRTRVAKIRSPWRISDGVALVADLSAQASSVAEDDRNWTTLLLARKKSGVGLSQLIEAIRNKRLTSSQRAEVAGFHAIVVQISEVDRMADPRHMVRDPMVDNVPAAMAASEFARSIGLRGGGTMQALIEAGHVTARRVMNPKTGRAQYRMTPKDITAFHQRFVTLTTLSAETELHRNTLRKILPSYGIFPFSPEGQDFGAVYLREDVVRMIMRDRPLCGILSWKTHYLAHDGRFAIK